MFGRPLTLYPPSSSPRLLRPKPFRLLGSDLYRRLGFSNDNGGSIRTWKDWFASHSGWEGQRLPAKPGAIKHTISSLSSPHYLRRPRWPKRPSVCHGFFLLGKLTTTITSAESRNTLVNAVWLASDLILRRQAATRQLLYEPAVVKMQLMHTSCSLHGALSVLWSRAAGHLPLGTWPPAGLSLRTVHALCSQSVIVVLIVVV
eukprot:jgi/Mesvir1/3414/Mv25297-RA.1